MKRDDTCPLEQVTCCQEVVEHHDPVDASAAPFQEGQVLDGRFVITEVLSRSGMGTVFKAEDKQYGNQLVAVKVPHLEYESDPNFFTLSARRADRPGVKPPLHP
jgi:hypothetical protein